MLEIIESLGIRHCPIVVLVKEVDQMLSRLPPHSLHEKRVNQNRKKSSGRPDSRCRKNYADEKSTEPREIRYG